MLEQETDRLRKSEARYRQIFENTPISMSLIASDGRPTEANLAFEQLYGMTIQQLSDRSFNIFDDPQLMENGTLPYIQRALAGETVVEPPTYYDADRTIPGAKLSYGRGHYFPIRNETGEVEEIGEICGDLTFLFELPQQILEERDRVAQERTNLLGAIAQVANLLLKSPDYTAVLPDVVKLLGEAVGSDRCGIGQDMPHPISDEPAVRTAPDWEWCKTEVLPTENFSPQADQFYLWEDAPYIAAQLIQGEVVNCLVADLPEPDQSLLAARSNTAELFVPILVNHQLWGFIAFDNCCEPRLYDEAEIAILKIAADSIAAAIKRQIQAQALLQAEQARTRSAAERSAELEKVNEALQQTIDALGGVNDFDEFVPAVLKIVAQAFGTNTCGYFEHFADAIIYLRYWFSNDRVLNPMELQLLEPDQYSTLRKLANGFTAPLEHLGTTARDRTRPAELAKANEALKRSLDTLAAEPELDRFLGHVMTAIVQQLNASSATLWFYNLEENTSTLHLIYENSAVMTAAQAAHPDAGKPIPLDPTTVWWQHKSVQRQPFVYEDVPHNPLLLLAHRQYLTRVETKTVLSAPLVLGNQVIGGICSRFSEARQFRSEELEFVQALTHQATLAMQLTRLAEEAKQAAIAREQEKAALSRVAELAKANEALKRTLDLLATEPTIDAFLGHVLIILTEQLQAASSSLWLFDWDAQTSSLHLVCQQGQIIPGAQAGYPSTVLPFADFRDDPGWRTVVDERRPWVHEAATSPSFTEAIRSQLMAQGVKTILSIPLVLGDQALGSFNIRLTTAIPSIPPEQIELAQALIHQATLAIRMTRLSEQVKDAALLEERNRMARDIHDTLAQSFTGIVIQLEAAKRIVTTEPDATQAHLTRASSLAREGLAEARRSVRALRPEALETHDLAHALQRLVQQMTAGTAIHTQVCVEGTPRPLPGEVETNLLRIGQEALTNTLRYAHAQTIQLELLFEMDAVHLQIVDDGQGFEPQPTPGGFGIIGMQERAQRLHGQFTLTSRMGQGTMIAVTLPIPY